jgi:hypothetical protein
MIEADFHMMPEGNSQRRYVPDEILENIKKFLSSSMGQRITPDLIDGIWRGLSSMLLHQQKIANVVERDPEDPNRITVRFYEPKEDTSPNYERELFLIAESQRPADEQG